MSSKIKIYTDGACSGNPGIGGWGAVLINSDTREEKYISGAESLTTNNKMELTATIKSLKSITFKQLNQKKLEFINFKKVNISSSQLRKI